MFNIFSKKDSKISFWDWFSKNSNKLYSFENNQDFLFHQLKDKLDSIDPNLVFEFSPILESGKREFVISADGISSSFDSVEDLTRIAPELPKWNIVAFRQPKPITESFCYRDIEVRFDDIYFSYNVEKGKIGLNLYLKGFTESADWTSLTFLLLDYVLGEYDTELYISWIEKYPYADQENLKPISELQDVLNQHKFTMLN